MRLIDADAFKKYIRDACNEMSHAYKDAGKWAKQITEDFCMDIDEQPTIEPVQQWIPCSEHPDTDRNVFIARGKTDFLSCCIGHYDHNLKLWYEDRNWFAKIMYDAMYWCEMPPLPEPWKGEQP